MSSLRIYRIHQHGGSKGSGSATMISLVANPKPKSNTQQHHLWLNPSTSATTTSISSSEAIRYYTAVIRYDNNVVTIPYVGCQSKAEELQQRMTKETHKHHVFLIETSRKNVPHGPYKSLEEATKQLLQQQHHEEDEKRTTTTTP